MTNYDVTIYEVKRELIYETNLIGQSLQRRQNMPKLMIYDDGSVEKRVVID